MPAPYEAIVDGASSAKDAALGALSSASSAVPLPELNLYLEPIHPGSDMSIKDRAQLVLQSARPWADFADVHQFNVPPLSGYKLRLQTNVETYFYNYFLLALAFLVVFAFGHLPSVVALVAVLAVAFFLYVLHPEPIDVKGVEVGTPAKHAIVVALALLALTVGHVFTLIFSLAVFLLVVVGVHGSIREVTEDTV
jgi:hypothetical protein